MKSLIQIILLLLLYPAANSQQVSLINIDQLNKRIENGRDTTFVINFWATWCVPCVKELPNFEKLNEAHKSDKLKILLVSVDFISKLNTTVTPFVKNKKIKSEVFLLNETDQQQYIDRIDTSWSGSIPATLFIKNGKRKFIEKEFTYTQLLTEYKTTL
jgi:thiol-disulfide isomerase/thioredoxin